MILGSFSSTFFLPPPCARSLFESSSFSEVLSSFIPLLMVEWDIPVSSFTFVIPPQPISSAIAPAKRLAWTSSAPEMAFSHHVYCLLVLILPYKTAYMIKLANLFFGNDLVYNLTEDETKAVSDHYPIYAEFYCDGAIDTPDGGGSLSQYHYNPLS